MAINYEARTQAYIDVDSSFGTASVNLVDGNLSFNHTDWEFGGGPTAFSLSHVYAGANYNNNQFYTGLSTGNGYGWKTNFDQYLIGNTTGAIYIDASGRKHTFKNSNGTIYDDGGLGLKLTKVNGTGPCKIVTDLVGNTMHFSATGYLCRIDTIFGNSIFIRHNANGSIKEIENGDNVATFTYNSNNLLSSVSYTGASETLNFEYSNGYLTTIKKTIGSSVSIQAQFAYTDNRLSRIYGNDYTDTRVTYSSGKVNQISTCSKSQGTALSYTTFTYTSANEAYATNEQGVKFKYTIHNNGDIVKIEEVIGTALYEVYPDKNPDSKQITDFYLGTSKLDDIASLNRTGSAYVTFDNTSTTANHLTVDDIRATLQSFAKGYSTFDIFYNNKKDRIAGATAESYSFKNKSNSSVLFSTEMLSQKTIIKDNNSNDQYEIVTKEMFDSSQIRTESTKKNIANSSPVLIDKEETCSTYTGLTKYVIRRGTDDLHYTKTIYTYDAFGNATKVQNQTIEKASASSAETIVNETVKTITYDSKGQYPIQTSNGQNTTYENILPHNLVTKVTNPLDVVKNIEYDAFKEKLERIHSTVSVPTSKTNSSNKLFENVFTYENQNIKTLNNGYSNYTFTYNSNTGDLESVKAQTTPLVTMSTNYSENKSTRVYPNNTSLSETTLYNAYRKPSSISYNGKTATFTYKDKNGITNSKGRLVELNDTFSNQKTTFAEYDSKALKFTVEDISQDGNSDKRKFQKKNYSVGNNSYLEYTIGNETTTYNHTDYNSLVYPKQSMTIRSSYSSLSRSFTCSYIKDKYNRITKAGYLLPYPNQIESTGINYTYAKQSGSNIELITGESNIYTGNLTTDRQYTYDSQGNITQVVFTDDTDIQYTTRYQYDNLNRLLREDNQKLNKTTVFYYDQNGNIDKKDVASYSTAATSSISFTTTDYQYTNSWKDVLTKYGTESNIIYNNGYPTSYRGKTMTWERGNLSSISDGIYTYQHTYDVYGRRIKTVFNNTETYYYFYDGNRLIAEHQYSTSSGSNPFAKTEYFYDQTGLCGCRIYLTSSSGTYDDYYRVTKDIMGNVVRLDGQEGCVLKIHYDAFGVPAFETKTLNNGLSPTEFFKLAFKGYYYDKRFGLYYLMSRYYDPEVGRFISPDSIDYLEPQSLLGMNLYAYCNNNPVMYADPSGHIPILPILIIGGLFALDAAIETNILMNSEQYKAENVYHDGTVEIPNSAAFNNPIAQLIYSNYLYNNVKKEDGSRFFTGSPYDIVGEWQAHNLAAHLTGALLFIGITKPTSLLGNPDIVSKLYDHHYSSVHLNVGPNINSEKRLLVRGVSKIYKWLSKILSLNILEW